VLWSIFHASFLILNAFIGDEILTRMSLLSKAAAQALSCVRKAHNRIDFRAIAITLSFGLVSQSLELACMHETYQN
jgi:hypothetical protein